MSKKKKRLYKKKNSKKAIRKRLEEVKKGQWGEYLGFSDVKKYADLTGSSEKNLLCPYIRSPRVKETKRNGEITGYEIRGICQFVPNHMKRKPKKEVDLWGLCETNLPMGFRECEYLNKFKNKYEKKFYIDYKDTKRGFITGRVPWRINRKGEREQVVVNLYLDNNSKTIRNIFVEGYLIKQIEEDERIIQEIEPLLKKDQKSFKRYIFGLEDVFAYEISGPVLPDIIADSMREEGTRVYSGNRPFGPSYVFGEKKELGKKIYLKERPSVKVYQKNVA